MPKYNEDDDIYFNRNDDRYQITHNSDNKIAAIVPKTELPFKIAASPLLAEEIEETLAVAEAEVEELESVSEAELESLAEEEEVALALSEDLVALEEEVEEDFLVLAEQV